MLDKPIDLTDHLKRLNPRKQRIKLIGVELEGGWEKLPPGVALVRDGSIKNLTKGGALAVEQARYQELSGLANRGALTHTQLREYHALHASLRGGNGTGLHIGELPSQAMARGQLANWMRTFYPSHVNETCGMHMHMSFGRPLTYQRLMTPVYPATVIRHMTRWAQKEALASTHPLWPRLRGESEYCQHVFNADDQVKWTGGKDYDHHRKGHRYSVVAYRWPTHQTVEIRLLPMFEKWDQALRAIEEQLNITEAFLIATKRREEKVPITVPYDDTSHRETLIDFI